MSCDTSGAQTTITLPAAAGLQDGQIQLVRCTGNMLSPVIVTAGAGTTVELLNAPGTFGASTWLPIQGESVFLKYDKATTQWKAWNSLNATGAPGTPAYNPGWYARTTVQWDPANASGTALDSNTGAALSPLLTWAEVIRRYGAIDPEFNYAQGCIVTQASAQPANADPVYFAPKLSGGAQAVLLGTLIANGAPFSPATVTAKNRATPTNLVLNTVPAYVVGKNLVQNTTSALKGWASVDSVAATNATMSQPVANSTITTVGIPTTTEDNAWANTDTYQAYTAPACNLKMWRPQGGDLNSVGWVQFVQLADSSGAQTSEYGHISDACCNVLSACVILPRVNIIVLNGRGQAAYLIGCDVTGAVLTFGGNPGLFGGIMRGGYTVQGGGNPNLAGDMIVHTSFTVNTGFPQIINVFCDAAVLIEGGAVPSLGAAGALWGTSAVTVQPGSALWNNTGTTWVLGMPVTGALKLGTATTGKAPAVFGTFVANGATPVNVVPGGTDHFPANAIVGFSMNAAAGTPAALFFSATQAADSFQVNSTALNTSTYNWEARDGTDNLTLANLDKYKGMYDEATGARFCNTV